MTTDTADVDRSNREAWARAAAGWEKWNAQLREVMAPVAQWLVEALDPTPGQRILEVAAGPGETGFLAAQRLGPTGKLVSSDQAHEMVAVAQRRAAELGIENVEFAVLDGQHIELPSNNVDGVLCRFGYMLMTDPDAALRETRRVIKDGGRPALATWDTPDRNLWLSTPAIALVKRGALPPPDPTAPGPFAMANPEQLEQRIKAAGFREANAQSSNSCRATRASTSTGKSPSISPLRSPKPSTSSTPPPAMSSARASARLSAASRSRTASSRFRRARWSLRPRRDDRDRDCNVAQDEARKRPATPRPTRVQLVG